MRTRLDESQQYHNHLEEELQAKDSKIQSQEVEKTLGAQKQRDIESLYESERVALLKEREEQSQREYDMQETIKRLRESLSQRGERTSPDRQGGSERHLKQSSQPDQSSSSEGDPQFAPPSSSPPQASAQDIAKAVAVKDQVIKSLRLELAECQIKIMELDVGGGSVRDLEKKLMDIQVENARLQEDNESFQLLLSEKTLNGEFTKSEAMQSAGGPGSLAEELGSDDLETAEGHPKSPKDDRTKRLENEIGRLQDQNKALSIYIEKIIGRLLQHKEFETIFDQDPSLLAGVKHPASDSPQVNTEKALPPPPPSEDANKGGGFLQRATSVMRVATTRRPRPLSQIQSPSEQPIANPTAPNEDPNTAPSIPLGRSTSVRGGHGRTLSDMPNAAPLVNQMYRGPSPSGLSGPLGSPGLSPSSTAARTSFFSQATSQTNPSTRVVSGSASRASAQEKPPGSSSNSTFSEHSGGVDGSPPRANNHPGGAVMTQSRLRPLRLVQENTDEDAAAATAARKKVNRASWMPTWMAQRPGGGNAA